jgi:hypothetical protein
MKSLWLDYGVEVNLFTLLLPSLIGYLPRMMGQFDQKESASAKCSGTD